MKTIGITGTYTVKISLNNYRMKVSDELYEELKELQNQEDWNELDFNTSCLLEDNHPDIIGLSDGYFESEDVIEFYE